LGSPLQWLSRVITIIISINKELDQCFNIISYREGKVLFKQFPKAPLLATKSDAGISLFLVGMCQLNEIKNNTGNNIL